MPLNSCAGGDLEPDAIGDARLFGAQPRCLDRAGVIVRPDERRCGERLGHQNRRRPVTAADVGDQRTVAELLLNTVEGGNPRVEKIRVVAGPEEALAPHVHVGVMLVPAVPRATACGIHDVLGVVHRAEGELEEAGQERRAVGFCHRDRVLRQAACSAWSPGRR